MRLRLEPSRFWAKTWTSSPAVGADTYWIETPRKRRRRHVPRSDVVPVGGRRRSAGTQRDLLRAHADADRRRCRAGRRGRRARAGARRRGSRTRRVPPSARPSLRVDQVRDPEEVRHELGARALVEVGGRADLLDPAVVHHGDRVGHRHRLLLVVRDVHERDADLPLDALELDLQLLAQAQVERAERLVEQQRPRAVDERAGERDALLLAAGQLRGLALARAWPSCTSSSASATRALDLGLGDLAALEPERDVLLDVRCGNSA